MMKRKLRMLLFICCALTSGMQARVLSLGSYDELLSATLSKMNAATSSNRLSTGVAELERLAVMYPDEWLTQYYISLYQIQQTLADLSLNQTERLKDAKNRIDGLKQHPKANQSEVSTIEGYYYTAIIASNPAQYGQVYYKEVLEAYQKALQYNPENPRAHLLLLIFQVNMASFTGNKKPDSLHTTLLELEQRFKQEHVAPLYPSWGMSTLQSWLDSLPSR